MRTVKLSLALYRGFLEGTFEGNGILHRHLTYLWYILSA
jgi:hypothetical protein